MILVTGASGGLGQAVIDFLLLKGESPANIAALVRTPAKAASLEAKGVQIRVGDYDDYASLEAAFAGVHKLLLVSSSDLHHRTAQHGHAVRAAQAAGVQHVHYTSFYHNNPIETSPIAFVGDSHQQTVQLIKESGMDYTIFNNNLYFEVLPMFFGDQVLERGIFLPAGSAKAAFTSRNDMAEAFANVLLTDTHRNKEYNISNTQNYSVAQIASIISQVANTEVAYVNPPLDVYTTTLTQAGVPEAFVGLMAGFATAIAQGDFSTSQTDLQTLLGRTPLSAETFFASVYAPRL